MTKVNGAAVSFPFATSANVTSIGGTCGTASGDLAPVAWSIGEPVRHGDLLGRSLDVGVVHDLGAGSYTATASQSDQAGNTGSSGSKSVTVDKTAPTVSSINRTDAEPDERRPAALDGHVQRAGLERRHRQLRARHERNQRQRARDRLGGRRRRSARRGLDGHGHDGRDNRDEQRLDRPEPHRQGNDPGPSRQPGRRLGAGRRPGLRVRHDRAADAEHLLPQVEDAAGNLGAFVSRQWRSTRSARWRRCSRCPAGPDSAPGRLRLDAAYAAVTSTYECSTECGRFSTSSVGRGGVVSAAAQLRSWTSDDQHQFAVRAVDAAGNVPVDHHAGGRGLIEDFTITGSAVGLLYPGGPARPIAVTLAQPEQPSDLRHRADGGCDDEHPGRL